MRPNVRAYLQRRDHAIDAQATSKRHVLHAIHISQYRGTLAFLVTCRQKYHSIYVYSANLTSLYPGCVVCVDSAIRSLRVGRSRAVHSIILHAKELNALTP
jgi:hypothetical protein